MKIFAVFGNPILHSKSPQLFNSVFKRLQIDAFYTRIRPQSASDLVDIFRILPLAGANITAPYKEDMLTLLDDLSADAKEIGAVNTIVKSNSRLVGCNTDHFGVTESLQNVGVNLLGSKCLVLGGGGAARAAVYGLTKKGADVFICNRTPSKAQFIANDFNCAAMDWIDFDYTLHFDVVVSTLLPEVQPPFLHLLKFSYLLDASYKPSEVTAKAKEMNVVVVEGKWWLINQAMAAYELFFGSSPSAQLMEESFSHKLDRDKLSILEFPVMDKAAIAEKRVDLIVSTKNNLEIKGILDEEISKAFGS
jgi:shikimate dehydrogenase